MIRAIRDRLSFHGSDDDESRFPASLQDVGKKLADDGYEIASLYYSVVRCGFLFIDPMFAIARIHENLSVIEYGDDVNCRCALPKL